MTSSRFVIALALAALPSGHALAAPSGADASIPTSSAAAQDNGIPAQLDADQRAGYRTVFASIRARDWTGAQLQLDAMKPGPLHAIARAELYTAKGSPRVERDPLVALLTEAPELPEAAQIAALAATRGATDLPALPETHKLDWIPGAPGRVRAKSIRSDAVSAQLDQQMRPFVKADDGAGAQALLDATVGLTPEAQTEWQQRVAWIYYLGGDDRDAQIVATRAQNSAGDWAVQATWVGGLAAWRQHDCATAATAFATVASRASDVDLRAAGLYWSSRANMLCGQPEKIEAQLKSAAQYDETFYGLLARQALGMRAKAKAVSADVADDWKALDRRPNVRVAAALVEIGETDLAGEVLRHQAEIGDRGDYAALVRLAGTLSLPETEIWLSHNGPAGAQPSVMARYPAPKWTPDGGWRVDKALVYAHTLQESQFNRDVVSPAGAYGLMQIRPGAASDIARDRGVTFDRASLTKPSINMEVGQSYLEQLRDQSFTGGLLPKVIAAYNAGPVPVQQWNAQARDGGDPLLYIESIPYWETRGYVTTVLRNYWMYEGEGGKAASPSRAALAQGLWPKFPGMPGASAVRITTPLAPRVIPTAVASTIAIASPAAIASAN